MLTKEQFNERLKAKRKECGYTQEQLCEVLKIKRERYAWYETDTYPPIPIFHKICKALNCSADYLLFLPEPNDEIDADE